MASREDEVAAVRCVYHRISRVMSITWNVLICERRADKAISVRLDVTNGRGGGVAAASAGSIAVVAGGGYNRQRRVAA